jgi:hypothetical protein
MTTISTLKFMPYAQAKVYTEGDNAVLRSYQTTVAVINGGYAFCYGLYSQTTRKHISAFARQFGLSYDIFKKCYTKNLMYNIQLQCFISMETGEIVEG